MSNAQQLFGPFLILMGATYIGYVWFKELKVKASQSWPSVSGKITRSKVVQKTSHNAASGSPNMTYQADIEYRYKVRTRSLKGHTICIGGEVYTSFTDRADRWVQRYPEDSEVTIYYNPKNPKEACLERSGEMGSWGYKIGGGLILVGALIKLGILF